ncbi:hypothetical protein TCAL_15265 [Tigriopus californicus]|uniref:Uncharacterized protein n=1 Tax=Tigriopus californicus TaxID=6832 RepID=A0A553NF79_TIGCA|nr:hypothetical protein TCAL_15265 [Tigriopus californicus]
MDPATKTAHSLPPSGTSLLTASRSGTLRANPVEIIMSTTKHNEFMAMMLTKQLCGCYNIHTDKYLIGINILAALSEPNSERLNAS